MLLAGEEGLDVFKVDIRGNEGLADASNENERHLSLGGLLVLADEAHQCRRIGVEGNRQPQ